MNYKKIVYYLPRILGIFLIGFISLFALDVFQEGYSIGELLVALLIHLVPSYILTLVLIIAWKKELIGGVLYILLGLFYIAKTGNEFSPIAWLMISGPLFLTGVLFILYRKKK